MKVKLLFVVDGLGCGGAEKSLVSLLNAIDYSKCDVSLQMIKNTGVFMDYLPKEVVLLPEQEYISSANSIRALIRNPKNLLTRIRTAVSLRVCPSRLHPCQIFWRCAKHSFSRLSGEYDCAFAWGQGTPTHFVIDNVTAKKKYAVINADYVKLGLDRSFDLRYYRKYDKVLVVSNSLRENIVGFFPEISEKIVVLYDLINADMIRAMAQTNPYESIRGKAILVTVGRLVEEKGYDILIDSAIILKDKGIDFTWYIIGEGPKRKDIELWINRNGLCGKVILLGLIENPYGYMLYSDIYVQTSRYEGYCLTLAEARILNKPIVTTCFAAAYDQIQNGITGIIAEMHGESVAIAIQQLIDNEELRSKLSYSLSKEKKGNPEEMAKFIKLIEADV